MNDGKFAGIKRLVLPTIWIICFIGLVVLVTAVTKIQPLSANPASPEVDNSSQVVDSSVEDFTLSNGAAYWTYCAGDLGDFTTYLMTQQLNDPTTKASLLAINSSSCVVYRELLSDPVFLYYKNESNKRIEKRSFLDINSAVTLFNYADSNEPTGLALADDYIYWSAADKTIRRVSIFGGAAQKVADTNGVPSDIAIDDANIWYGTTEGVYWLKRDCQLPCKGSLVYNSNVKKIFAAGRAAPTYKAAVFWIANNKSSPNSVESYDCNVPGQKGCYHKILYQGTSDFSVDSVSGADDHVFWIEVDTVSWTRRFLRRAPRDCSSPCSATKIDKLVDPVSPIGDWHPSRMILDDVDIYFRHKGISRLAQDAAPLVWNIVYDGLEVTQAIQSLQNNVSLVIDKPTYVRLYAHLSGGDDIIGPEAQLVGTYNGAPLPGSPLQPLRRPNRLAVDTAMDRDDMQSAWLFELPREWTEKGTIVLKATIDPRKLYDATPPSSPLTSIPFFYRPPICVVGLKVSQHGPTARHSDASFQLAVKTAETILPTSDIWVYHQGTVLEEGLWPFYSPYELPSDSGILKGNIMLRDRFSDDPDECDLAGARTLYTGMIHPNTSTGGVKGSAFVGFDQSWTKLPLAGNAWGVKYAGWPLDFRESTLAHEFGHNFGRWHVNCPEGDPDDTEYYPYDDPCVLSNSEGERVYYGYDPILSQPITPTEGSDLMSYQLPRWISNYTWEKIFEKNMPVPFLDWPTSVEASPDLFLSGHIDSLEPSSSELDYAWVMPAGTLSTGLQSKWQRAALAVQPQSPTAPRYYVRFIGLGNSVLAERDVTLIPSSEETASDEKMAFNVSTTAPSSLVVKVQLMADETVLDTLAPGLFVPQVAVEEPAWGTVADQSLFVRWTASDPGGDTLKFIVQFSHDLGQHWQTLATDITGTPGISQYEATFDTSSLPGSSGLEALVRVIASDGYNTAMASSEKFLTVLKAPEVTISSPPNGIWYEAGQTITLEGSATDPEDGHMAGSALDWSLNNNSYGSGDHKLVAGLAPGTYRAKLTATDLDYKQGTAQSTFTIAPWKIASGAAKLDGGCTDAAYANTQPIQLKPYGDGNQASVTAVRDERYIWFCFSGLNKGTNHANSFTGVRLDANFSQDTWAQSSDYGFFVRPDGSQFTRQGNGAGGFNEKTFSFVENSLATRVRPDVGGQTWSAELRIEYYYTGLGDRIGIDLGHYWVNGQGNDYHWPYNAKYNQPATWAENFTTAPPTIKDVTPEVVTLPKSSQTLEINGLDFVDGDRVWWDGLVLRTTFGSHSKLYAEVQAGSLTPGEHRVTVVRNVAGEMQSNPIIVNVQHPVPILTSLTPPEITAGSGDIQVDLLGSAFFPKAIVYWDGQPLKTTYISGNKLQITVPASQVTRPGDRTIVVANPDPTSGVSNPLQLLISGYKIFLPQLRR